MNPLLSELNKVVNGGRYTSEQGKQLMALNWRLITDALPESVRQEADVLYYLIQGALEEIEEGYVADTDDPEMLGRIKVFAETLSAVAPQ